MQPALLAPRRTRHAERTMAIFCALAMLVLVACSPIIRAAGRCPSTATLAVDFVLSSVGLAIAADRYNAGQPAASLTAFGAGMTVAVAANVAECRR